jgi:hypothetical protein
MSCFSKWLDKRVPAKVVTALAAIAARLLRGAADKLDRSPQGGRAIGIGAALERAAFEDRLAESQTDAVVIHGGPSEAPAATSGGPLEPERVSEAPSGAFGELEPSGGDLSGEAHSGPRAIGGYVGRGITPAPRRDR